MSSEATWLGPPLGTIQRPRLQSCCSPLIPAHPLPRRTGLDVTRAELLFWSPTDPKVTLQVVGTLFPYL